MDRTVLITGGTGALGTAVTRNFLEDGYRVAATWAVEKEANALREELGPRPGLFLVETDVTDPSSVETAVQKVTASLGPIDALVHLVGGWKGGEKVHEHSIETWHRMLELNLHCAFLCCRAVLPSMLDRNWGRIVVVSSRTARSGRAGQAGYAVGKAGVAVLAETIAEETRGTNVTANIVAPSTLDTPANRRSMPNSDFSTWVPPEAVAATIAFLVSEEAGQMRGAWLPIYGSA